MSPQQQLLRSYRSSDYCLIEWCVLSQRANVTDELMTSTATEKLRRRPRNVDSAAWSGGCNRQRHVSSFDAMRHIT